MSQSESDSDRQTEVTDEVRLPDGTFVKEYTNPETGNVSYRRTGKDISGAQYISPTVAKALQSTTELGGEIELAEGEMEQQELNRYGIAVTAETLRKKRIENKYTRWDENQELNTNRILGGDEYRDENWVKGWMDNNEVKRMIENDPLLETSGEKRRAREALAREIVERLKEADTRDEAKYTILRNYGIY